MGDDLRAIEGEDDISREVRTNATHAFMCVVRTVLASKRVVGEYRISRLGWEWLLEETKRLYHRGVVDAGEMVGTLAAQSIGEPTTQMCLNSEFSGPVVRTRDRP